jgi:hypothetical protein
MKMHQSITEKRVLGAVKRRQTTLDNPGFCVACGAEAEGCEPDMREGECESCGEPKVYGAEELFFELEE